MSEPERTTGAALERIAQAVRVWQWNEGKRLGLTPIQLQVLLFLRGRRSEECRLSYLSAHFDLTKATLSETVSTLEGKGLIVRTANKLDGRSRVLQLTQTGEQMVGQISTLDSFLEPALQGLQPGQKEDILLSILHLIKALQQSGLISLQRMCFTCRHYRADISGSAHYCNLLEERLTVSALRIECVEHDPLATLP